jgi:hypothetical protein
MNRAIKVTSAGFSALAVLALASVASAEQGELQAGVATPVLLHTRITLEQKAGGATARDKGSTTNWGIGHNVLGEIGYGVTPNLVVGGLFRLAGSSNKDDEDGNLGDSSTFSLLLGPKLDYMFLPGDKVQPFIGAVAGLSNAFAKAGGAAETSATGFQLMGRFGIRAYPNSKFSFDPQLVVGQEWSSGERTAGSSKVDISGSTFQIGVFLGISGWI